MLEKLSKAKPQTFSLDLTDNKNRSFWVLKEKSKDQQNLNLNEKNIILYASLGLYLQKLEKKKFRPNLSYYEIKFDNLITDIFPFERNPEINFMFYNSKNENLFGSNYYENRKNNTYEKKMDALRRKMINNDIPEMILYKYKYDKNLYDELMEDWDDEPEFIYNLIKDNSKYRHLNKKEDTINCIKNLITIHKIELYDIAYIIKQYSSIYNKIFKDEDVIFILSLYDAQYIQFKLKQRKIKKLQNQLIMTTNLLNKISFSYLDNSKNEFDLNLVLSYIGYQISVMNFNSQKKFCDNLMDLNLNLSSKKILQLALEDECDKIVSKFCLSPEEVEHNLKIIKNEDQGNLKLINNECNLMELCIKKVSDLLKKNKKYHPLQILQKSINYYIISLSSNPYIAKLIFNAYLKSATISTSPTEKGKIILNANHPSYKVKNLKKYGLDFFINKMRNNENDFSEIFLNIEKAEKEGLIKFKIDIDMKSKYIQELVHILNIAINGQNEDQISDKNSDDKSINLSDSEEIEISKVKSDTKKNSLVRSIAIKNMILDDIFTQKFFLNYIKRDMHNIAEKILIEKICDKFYTLINKKYMKKNTIESYEDKYYYSIFFINLNTFCYLAIDKNKKRTKFKSILNTQILLNEENELKDEMCNHKPKYIILGINNIGAYQLINYFDRNDSIIFSDYLSLLKIPKKYDINSTIDKNYYYNIAYDQFKFTMNPLEFFIENYNFKYENNLLLNIKFHYLQGQIHDMPLLNYCLETQIRRTLNLYKFKYEKGKNQLENYYTFMNGLGPLTCKLIEDYKNKPLIELQNVTGTNILKNISLFINDNNNMEIEKNNQIEKRDFIVFFTDDDLFNKMLNSYCLIKNKSIHNFFVNNVDNENKVINCVLFYNENIVKCYLPFKYIDNIFDINTYFKKNKFLLCKIIEIQIEREGYQIIISNKIEDLEFFETEENISEISFFNYNEKEEDNKIIEMQKLKNVLNFENKKKEKCLLKIDENEFCKNIILDDIKKDFISIEDSGRYFFRPSFLGNNHLMLTLNFCENLTLNYDVLIKKEDEYILNKKEYKNIKDIIKLFINPLLKNIYEYKTNKYFKSPTQMQSIFSKIFIDINKENDINSINKNILSPDEIYLCFLDDSPNYGLLITKAKNNNINIDYIEFSTEGYYFHNKLFININDIIEYYIQNNEKQFYKEFICNNIIYDIHSRMEYIDLQYKKIVEKSHEILDWISNEKNEDETEEKKYLGKKRSEANFEGWGNDENEVRTGNIFQDLKEQNSDKIFYNSNNNIDLWDNNSNENSNNNFWTNNNINSSLNNFNNDSENFSNNNNDTSFRKNSNQFFNSDNNNNSWNNNNFFSKNSFNNNSRSNNNYYNYSSKNDNRSRSNSNKNIFNNNNYNKKGKFSNNQGNNKYKPKPRSNFSWNTYSINNDTDNKNESNHNNSSNDIMLGWSNDNNNNNKDNNIWNNKNDDNNWNNFNNKNNSNNNSFNNFYNKNNNNNNKNINNNRPFKNNINNNWNNNVFNLSNDNHYNISYNQKKSFNNKNKSFNKNRQFHNNNSRYNFHNNNTFNKKKSGPWANVINDNTGKDDIKNDNDEGVIDFSKVDSFGGYNVNENENKDEGSKDKDNNENNNEPENNEDNW